MFCVDEKIVGNGDKISENSQKVQNDLHFIKLIFNFVKQSGENIYNNQKIEL